MKRINGVGGRAGAILRIHMGGIAVLTWGMAISDASAMMHMVGGTAEGAILIWLLMFLGAATMVDAFLNDVLPARFHWRVALRQRHFLLFALAFCYVAQLYVAFYGLRSTALLLYYLWNAGMLILVAFLDAHQRSKDATCVIVCN